VQIHEFEQAVWRVDRLRLLVRGPKDAIVGDYDWVKAADQGLTVTEYIKTRITLKVMYLQFSIVDGSGKMPNGKTKIGNLRQSYRDS